MLFADGEKKTLEVVSGRIETPQAHLINGIAVGMRKRAFFATFFKKPAAVEKEKLSVIELVSGLDGIRHYYDFQHDTLVRITFDTDYQFSKR